MAMTISVPDPDGKTFYYVNVPEPGDVSIKDLVRMVYSKISIILIHSRDNKYSWLVPVTPNCEREIPFSAITANAFEIISTGKTLGDLVPNAITQNFWTCDCMENFVHHKIKWECEKCRITIPEDRFRLPYINSLITWDLFVG